MRQTAVFKNVRLIRCLLAHVCFFIFSLGYEPMKGDWVQAKYFINPTQWTTQAQSVAPLRYSRLDQVIVSLKVYPIIKLHFYL